MKGSELVESSNIILEETVPARQGWAHRIARGDTLVITDLEGQQAVDYLCFDTDDPGDRYSATNTIKVQGNVYVGLGTVLYADSGNALMTVVTDTIGRHDTIYGCCSIPNNRLRYGVETTESCYTNFETVLAPFGLGREAIVPNINWFMSVPILEDGSAGVAEAALQPGSRVALRAERDVLAVLSNCPQMHNPCNGYNPTPIRVQVVRPPASTRTIPRGLSVGIKPARREPCRDQRRYRGELSLSSWPKGSLFASEVVTFGASRHLIKTTDRGSLWTFLFRAARGRCVENGLPSDQLPGFFDRLIDQSSVRREGATNCSTFIQLNVF